jgi:hypothetical protein
MVHAQRGFFQYQEVTMKMSFTAAIVYDAPTREHPKAVKCHGYLTAIARNEEEARSLIEQHLAERKPLGFTEREIRKMNPKRTPWIPGLEFLYFLSGYEVSDEEKIGVVFDDDR